MTKRTFVLFLGMTKGEATRTAILEAGMDLASRLGLESVTIGALAKATRMSKSGLFAHFQSKENLQIEILKYAGNLFAQAVVVPALKTRAGIGRIKALVGNWQQWDADLTGGCIFVAATSDLKNRPGKVRDYLIQQQEAWIDTLRRIAKSAVRVGDFREDIDFDQFSFELYSLLLGFHLYDKLLNYDDIEQRQQTALEQLLNAYR